jgi:hypothetical protein
MKRYSSKSWQGKLDKLVGDHFRSRSCELAATDKSHVCVGRIEWAHLKSRRYLSTRWLLTNAFSLCSSAHFWFTNHPDLFTKWIEINYPGRLEEVNKAFNLNTQLKEWQLEELYNRLKDELT